MPKITIIRKNLDEHDPWSRHRLAYGMDLWNFSYTYAVLTLPINQHLDGIKSFENFPVVPLGFPVEDEQVASKFYVDNSITFGNLLSNGDIGIGADQVAYGDHIHDTMPDVDQKGAMDSAQDPSVGNPFTVWEQFSLHNNRHANGGADELSHNSLAGLLNDNHHQYFLANGDRALTGSFNATGVLTPPQIVNDQDDYNPIGITSNCFIRLSSDGLRNITGLQSVSIGRIIIMLNVGSNNVVLKNESVSSSEGNRFSLKTDLTLVANASAIIYYDGVSLRWKVLGTY